MSTENQSNKITASMSDQLESFFFQYGLILTGKILELLVNRNPGFVAALCCWNVLRLLGVCLQQTLPEFCRQTVIFMTSRTTPTVIKIKIIIFFNAK